MVEYFAYLRTEPSHFIYGISCNIQWYRIRERKTDNFPFIKHAPYSC